LNGRRLPLLIGPVVAVLLFLPTLGHDFVFDDHAVIGQNPLMHDLRDLPRLLAAPYWNTPTRDRMLYRPVTSVSFALDRAIARGLDPRWFHLVNVLLHATASLLVAVWAATLLPGRTGPAAAGLLFAVHPVHVEAVAGIVGRAEILAACAVLGAILCHRAARAAIGWRCGLLMTAAWTGTLLGAGAKESAVVAPVLCLVADAFVPAPPGRRRVVLLYAGHAAALGIYFAARVLVLGTIGIGRPIPFVDNPAASAGAIDGRLTALGTVARYAVLLLWPRRLSADYSYDQIPVVRSPLDPWALAGLALVIGVVAGGVLLRRRAPVVACAFLFTAVAASLTSNLVVFIGTILAERLMYLPSAGVCLLGAAGAAWLARRRGLIPSVAAVAVAAGAGAARTAVRLPEWKDDLALYSSAARVSPRSARIRYNLGNAHLRLERHAEAETEYRAALAIYPEFGDARVNLGMALLQQGRGREALPVLEGAARRDPGSPDLAVNLGNAWRAVGEPARAREEFERALRLDPRSARAWNNLGSLALGRGDLPRALECLRRAVDLDPSYAVFRVNLADALVAAGRPEEADARFLEAYHLDPGLPESRRGMGEVLLRRGDAAGAEREFRAAVAATRPSARAANFLGYLLAGRGDARGAAAAYLRAVALDPALHDAHRSLGYLYAGPLADPERARRHLETSLALDPGQPEADAMRKILGDLSRRNRGGAPGGR
jgi:tetratricopeptide (TPR) repeat protein